MGARLAFQIWANSPAGITQVTDFSVQNRIEQSAWVDALLFMAVAQVLIRTLVLYARGRSLRRTAMVTA